MLFTDVIRTKRDGEALDEAQIKAFVDGLADESIPAEQVSALAMAIFLNGMQADEAARLTLAMARSGEVLDWSDAGLHGPVVDKHSTGGVGDKVSFLLAPIVAACGAYVPMISGRGLGHTGGTTDKAESIPGYCTAPDVPRFRNVVRDAGCAIIGQTADIAPADRRFYAIRDVTGTVESIPLITASILSKKIAAGLDALVMDVKTGNGAFMQSPSRAKALAESIMATANVAGLTAHAVLTDMNEVLGTTAGNALEIAESMRFLSGREREPRLREVVMTLSAEMLLATGLAADREAARQRCERALADGYAAQCFDKMCEGLGGPANFVEAYASHLPVAPVEHPVHAKGYLAALNTRAIGNAVIELGGGRRKVGETLNLSVGFSRFAGTGTLLDRETPLAIVHAASKDDARRAEQTLLAACEFADEPPAARPVIGEILS